MSYYKEIINLYHSNEISDVRAKAGKQVNITQKAKYNSILTRSKALEEPVIYTYIIVA